MNQRHLALLALASASVCAVVFTACGGDDTNNADSGNDATTDVVGNDTTPPPDTGPTEGGGNDGGTDSATDTGCAPGPNCRACCVQNNPDAAAIFFAAETTCACTTPGLCNTNQTCKNNLCNNQAASTNCNACLADKDAGDCFNTAAAACIQNQACQPLVQCVAQCGSADAGGGG